jgi:hypothetical protein
MGRLDAHLREVLFVVPVYGLSREEGGVKWLYTYSLGPSGRRCQIVFSDPVKEFVYVKGVFVY